MNQCPVITIDGPSGTGKGTLCINIAKKLGWNVLDSGALYRLVAMAAKKHRVDSDDDAGLEQTAKHLDVHFQLTDSGIKTLLEGVDVSDAIRSEECGQLASKIAAKQGVRKALLERQRAFATAPGLVTDGRDMGTVVFPDAALKIYLDASQEIRAQRRYLQLQQKGINASLAQVVEELTIRDARDSSRDISPLKAADNSVKIDTTNMNIGQVEENVLHLIQKQGLL